MLDMLGLRAERGAVDKAMPLPTARACALLGSMAAAISRLKVSTSFLKRRVISTVITNASPRNPSLGRARVALAQRSQRLFTCVSCEALTTYIQDSRLHRSAGTRASRFLNRGGS